MARTPKFADQTAWQQAEILMQPALIRVIDNIRKQLETSSWRGDYQTVALWPEGTTEETKAQVALLQSELEAATGAEAEAIAHTLAQLPKSYPGYVLSLHKGDNPDDTTVDVDLWQLCYSLCFLNYSFTAEEPHPLVEIDTSLLDDQGEVDWERLDSKAKDLIGNIFNSLSSL